MNSVQIVSAVLVSINYLDDVPNAVTKAGPSLTIILYGDWRVHMKYIRGSIINPCISKPVKTVKI